MKNIELNGTPAQVWVMIDGPVYNVVVVDEEDRWLYTDNSYFPSKEEAEKRASELAERLNVGMYVIDLWR